VGVATTIMHHSEPIKERAEPTTLGITAIKIPNSTSFILLLMLRLNVRPIRGVFTSPHHFPISQAQDDLQWWIAATETLEPFVAAVEFALHPQHETFCDSEIQTRKDFKSKFRKQLGSSPTTSLNSEGK